MKKTLLLSIALSLSACAHGSVLKTVNVAHASVGLAEVATIGSADVYCEAALEDECVAMRDHAAELAEKLNEIKDLLSASLDAAAAIDAALEAQKKR